MGYLENTVMQYPKVSFRYVIAPLESMSNYLPMVDYFLIINQNFDPEEMERMKGLGKKDAINSILFGDTKPYFKEPSSPKPLLRSKKEEKPKEENTSKHATIHDLFRVKSHYDKDL